MAIFQSWLDTLIMFTLAIGYIITFIVQLKVIKGLQIQLSEVNNTNKAIKELADTQDVHITTYKKMVDIEQIEKYTYILAENRFAEMMQNKDEVKQIFKGLLDEFLEKDIYQKHLEQIAFMVYIFKDLLKCDYATTKKIFKHRVPKSEEILMLYYQNLEQDKVDTQKTQT